MRRLLRDPELFGSTLGVLFGLSLGVFFALVVSARPTEAQGQQCGARADVLGVLDERWGEAVRSLGLTNEGAVVETFANGETGTWTITVTFPDGRTCLIASGDAFETIREALVPIGEAL